MKRRPPRAEEALARVVLDRHLALRRGESVTIESWSHGLPWARSFVVEARRRGAHAVLVLEDEEAYFRSLEVAGSSALSGTSHRVAGGSDAYVYFGGPEAFHRLLGVPERDLESLVARHDAVRWRMARRSRTRAVRLAIADATPAAAERYGVDATAWQSELLAASLIDPLRLETAGRPLLRDLRSLRTLRIQHPNGTDLRVSLTARAPILDSGRPDRISIAVSKRIPSGLLIVPLRGGTAEGVWETNRPAYDRFARPPVAEGGRFEFRSGRLREFAFDRGGESFAAAYSGARRGRDRAVALTIGLNPAVSNAPEVLELGVGTLGLLLGDAPYRGGGQRSGFSFLAVLAGASVTADGRPWWSGE
jgi:leucyl aminopeptidase (aminopeptidase T)